MVVAAGTLRIEDEYSPPYWDPTESPIFNLRVVGGGSGHYAICRYFRAISAGLCRSLFASDPHSKVRIGPAPWGDFYSWSKSDGLIARQDFRALFVLSVDR